MKRLLVILCVLLVPRLTAAQCDQTFSSASGLVAATTSAPNGTTICLNTANYGTVNFFSLSARTGFVTLRSTSGTGAQMSPQVDDSKFIRFQSMTLTNVNVTNCTTNHIEFVSTPFLVNTPGLFFNPGGTCGAQALLVDGATFDGVNTIFGDGRLATEGGVNGLTVTNSHFGASGANHGHGDGIQLGGCSNCLISFNTFDSITQAYCDSIDGMHCDAIQFVCGCSNVTIEKNWFKNGTTYIMSPDNGGQNNITYQNNVFDGFGDNYFPKLQIKCTTCTFSHNTLLNTFVILGSKTGEPASSNITADSNLFVDGADTTSEITNDGNGCTSCTYRKNMFTANHGSQVGTNPIFGTPTFMGGAHPTTWAGWQLTAGSTGHLGGNDGADVGTLYYGTTGADVTAPVVIITAPTSNPTYAITRTPITTVAGTASDAVGVTSCTWTDDRGGSGTATGTTTWSIPSITLALGLNVLTVTCVDAAANAGNDAVTVTYTIPILRLRLHN